MEEMKEGSRRKGSEEMKERRKNAEKVERKGSVREKKEALRG